jgi:hypothetical protein
MTPRKLLFQMALHEVRHWRKSRPRSHGRTDSARRSRFVLFEGAALTTALLRHSRFASVSAGADNVSLDHRIGFESLPSSQPLPPRAEFWRSYAEMCRQSSRVFSNNPRRRRQAEALKGGHDEAAKPSANSGTRNRKSVGSSSIFSVAGV